MGKEILMKSSSCNRQALEIKRQGNLRRDIIKFFDCDGDGYTVPVVWDNDYACFSVDWGSNMLTSFDYLEEFYTDLKDIKVIGNIYDNLSLTR